MTTPSMITVTDDAVCGPAEQTLLNTKYGLFIHPVSDDHPQNDSFAMVTIVTQHDSHSQANTTIVETPAELETLIENQITDWNGLDVPIIVSQHSLTVRVHPAILPKCDVETIIETTLTRSSQET